MTTTNRSVRLVNENLTYARMDNKEELLDFEDHILKHRHTPHHELSSRARPSLLSAIFESKSHADH